MLATMFALMLVSILNESAIVDELAHIPAGYAYATKLDYRLNPEHPPLLKAISGAFVRVFVNPRLPVENPSWKNEINGQWGMGYSFLYGVGNDADAIIFWARIPVILLSLFLGWLLYRWTYKRFGSGAALSTLALFCFSPTILAHSRYMTTDLGASFGFFIGIITFIQLLDRPTLRNTIIAGICFGIAQLLKFSLVLLVPMYGIIFLLWIITMPFENKREWMAHSWFFLKRIALGLLMALGVIWIFYGLFTYNYPPERQLRDTTYLLSSYGFRPAANLDLWLVEHPLTRPLGHYILGVLMVQQRAAGGNTAFFLDEVSNKGSRLYFPLLYFLKEPTALHIFGLIALWHMTMQFRSWRRRRKTHPMDTISWRRAAHTYFIEWSCMICIAVYWAVSIKSPLNIGIRHVLPTFPFLYILITRGVTRWMHNGIISNPQTWNQRLANLFKMSFFSFPKYIAFAFLMFWIIIGTFTVAPHFLSFYNELAYGTPQGWKIAVDSNYDWGQDLKRLADFVDKNNIQHISLDYFGGGVPSYYLGNRVEQWSGSRGQPKGWFAISSTFRQGDFGTPINELIPTNPGQHYEWLKQYPPIARAGYSIFIYKLPE